MLLKNATANRQLPPHINSASLLPCLQADSFCQEYKKKEKTKSHSFLSSHTYPLVISPFWSFRMEQSGKRNTLSQIVLLKSITVKMYLSRYQLRISFLSSRGQKTKNTLWSFRLEWNGRRNTLSHAMLPKNATANRQSYLKSTQYTSCLPAGRLSAFLCVRKDNKSSLFHQST